jgi:hypothetical protein
MNYYYTNKLAKIDNKSFGELPIITEHELYYAVAQYLVDNASRTNSRGQLILKHEKISIDFKKVLM